MPASLVELYDMNNTLNAVKFAQPENWDRPSKEWVSPQAFSENAAVNENNLTRFYFESAGQKALDRALTKEQQEKLSSNLLDILMVSGVSAREMSENFLHDIAFGNVSKNMGEAGHLLKVKSIMNTLCW